MIAPIVYALCAAMSLVCTVLLWRRFLASRAPLLFWSGACFLAFTANNLLLFIDRIVVPNLDLSVWRVATNLVGIILLLYGIFRTGGPE